MRNNRFLITDNVFLDASIFEEQNFFHGTKIHSISYYANREVVKLYMTALSKREIIDRIEKKIRLCRLELKATEKKYNDQNLRFIKNLNIFENRQILQFGYEEEKEIFNKLTSFITRAKVKTISTHKFPVMDVFEMYYSGTPPFGTGKKKYEFIDAFILKTLETWCERHDEKMYVISKDPDFLKYESDRLIILDDLGKLLGQISDYYNLRFKLRKSKAIKQYISSNTGAIEDLIAPMISEKLIIKNEKGTIQRHEIANAKIEKYNILSYREKHSEIEFIFKVYVDIFQFVDEMEILKEDYDRLNRFEKHSISIEIPVDTELVEKKLDVKRINSNEEYILVTR